MIDKIAKLFLNSKKRNSLKKMSLPVKTGLPVEPIKEIDVKSVSADAPVAASADAPDDSTVGPVAAPSFSRVDPTASWGDGEEQTTTTPLEATHVHALEASLQRSIEEIDAELNPVKDEIKAKQTRQSTLLKELATVSTNLAAGRSPDVINQELNLVKEQIKAIQKTQTPLLRERAAAVAAAAPEEDVVPFHYDLEPPPLVRTMLFIIGPNGEFDRTQAYWKTQWRKAITKVKAEPRKKYLTSFATLKNQFEGHGCSFENRPSPPRGGAHA